MLTLYMLSSKNSAHTLEVSYYITRHWFHVNTVKGLFSRLGNYMLDGFYT